LHPFYIKPLSSSNRFTYPPPLPQPRPHPIKSSSAGAEGPVWVAAQGDQLVGAISAVPKSAGLYIRSMAVLPSARGYGIGYILLQSVEQFAIAKGYRRTFLSTTPFLHGAIRLYEHFGFQRNNDGPHELFGTPLFTMVKLLEPANQD